MGEQKTAPDQRIMRKGQGLNSYLGPATVRKVSRNYGHVRSRLDLVRRDRRHSSPHPEQARLRGDARGRGPCTSAGSSTRLDGTPIAGRAPSVAGFHAPALRPFPTAIEDVRSEVGQAIAPCGFCGSLSLTTRTRPLPLDPDNFPDRAARPPFAVVERPRETEDLAGLLPGGGHEGDQIGEIGAFAVFGHGWRVLGADSALLLGFGQLARARHARPIDRGQDEAQDVNLDGSAADGAPLGRRSLGFRLRWNGSRSRPHAPTRCVRCRRYAWDPQVACRSCACDSRAQSCGEGGAHSQRCDG